MPYLIAGALAICTSASGQTSHHTNTVSVCDLISRPDRYDKHQITLEAELVMGSHAGNLLDAQCSENGAIKLVMDEKTGKDAKVIAMIGKVMRNHAKGHVVLVGFFHKTPVDTFKGSFFLSRVSDIAN